MPTKKEDKLKWILGRYFLLFSVISMVIGLSIYSVLAYDSQKNSSWENIIYLRDEQGRYLNNWFLERAKIINNISFCKAVKEQDLAEMKNLFKEHLGITTGFENLAYANREGNVLLYGDVEYTNISVADREYFRLAMQGESCLSELMVSRFTDNPIVIVSSPVISEQGQISGVIFAPLKWSKIMQIISFYRLGDTGETYIVDKKGMIFSSNSDKSPDQLKTKAAVIQNLRSKEGSCDQYLDDQGFQVYGAYTDLKNFKWGLLVEIDKDELFIHFRKDFGIALLLCFLIIGVIIYPCSSYITRKIVSPLELMTKDIIEFAQCCEKEGNCQLKDRVVYYQEVAAVKESFAEIGQKVNHIHTVMQSQIFYEPLTGLANKRYFLLRGQEIIELAYRKQTNCSLIYFSIDRFKQIKEDLGQEVCDRILLHIADILGKTTRLSDVLGRPGENEFALFLPETDADEVWQIAEKYRQEVEKAPLTVEFNALSLSVSIGIAAFLGNSEKYINSIDLLEKLFEESRNALLWAQEKGGNRVELTCL